MKGEIMADIVYHLKITIAIKQWRNEEINILKRKK